MRKNCGPDVNIPQIVPPMFRGFRRNRSFNLVLIRRELPQDASEAHMLEDLRNHDPAPTEEEKAWMGCAMIDLLLRSAAALAIATTVGVSASPWSSESPAAPRVADAAPAR